MNPAQNNIAVRNRARTLSEMICPTDSRRHVPRQTLIAGLGIALSVAFAGAGIAQQRGPSQVAQANNPDKAEKADALKQREGELQAARDAQRRSLEAEAALRREIEQIGADRRKLNEALIDAAAKLRGVEAKITATEARMKPLDANEQTIRKSLEGGAPSSAKCSPPCSASAIVRRPRSSPARKTPCRRYAPRWCSARCCRRCGHRSMPWRTTSPASSPCASRSPPNATG